MEIISWRSLGTHTFLKHCKITRKNRIHGCFCSMCKLHTRKREKCHLLPQKALDPELSFQGCSVYMALSIRPILPHF